MAVVLQKAFQLQSKGQNNFKDVPQDHWAYKLVIRYVVTEYPTVMRQVITMATCL